RLRTGAPVIGGAIEGAFYACEHGLAHHSTWKRVRSRPTVARRSDRRKSEPGHHWNSELVLGRPDLVRRSDIRGNDAVAVPWTLHWDELVHHQDVTAGPCADDPTQQCTSTHDWDETVTHHEEQ